MTVSKALERSINTPDSNLLLIDEECVKWSITVNNGTIQ